LGGRRGNVGRHGARDGAIATTGVWRGRVAEQMGGGGGRVGRARDPGRHPRKARASQQRTTRRPPARRPRRSDRQAGHGNTAGARAKRGQANNTQRAAHRARRPRRSKRQAVHGNTAGAHAKHAQGEGSPVGWDADDIGRLGLLVSCYRVGAPTGRARPPGGRAHREGAPTGRARPPEGRAYREGAPTGRAPVAQLETQSALWVHQNASMATARHPGHPLCTPTGTWHSWV